MEYYPTLLLPSSIIPIEILKDNLSTTYDRKGETEDFFKRVLLHHFKEDEIYDNKGIDSLRPDFVIVRRSTNIAIALEIDESYSLLYNSKEPIHLLGSDNFKNSKFVRAGFHVLRIAESQVIQSHTQCVLLIETILNGTPKLDCVHQVPKWSEEEARYFISIEYREALLKLKEEWDMLYNYSWLFKYLRIGDLNKYYSDVLSLVNYSTTNDALKNKGIVKSQVELQIFKIREIWKIIDQNTKQNIAFFDEFLFSKLGSKYPFVEKFSFLLGRKMTVLKEVLKYNNILYVIIDISELERKEFISEAEKWCENEEIISNMSLSPSEFQKLLNEYSQN